MSSCGEKNHEGYIDESIQKWENGTNYTLEFLNMISDENLSFRATSEEMTIAEQVIHMGSNMQRLGNLINTSSPEVNAIDTTATLPEIVNFFTASSDYAKESIAKNKSQVLSETVPFQATTMTKRQIIELLHDHHTHHRGQLVVYWRMLGLKPPQYRGW